MQKAQNSSSRFGKLMRGIALTVVTVMAGVAGATPFSYAEQLRERNEANKPRRISELKPGLTQCLTPQQWRKVDAKRAADAKAKEAAKPAVRLLTGSELASLRGRGSYRNKYLAGTLP